MASVDLFIWQLYNCTDDTQLSNRKKSGDLGFYPSDRLVGVTLSKLSSGFQYS